MKTIRKIFFSIIFLCTTALIIKADCSAGGCSGTGLSCSGITCTQKCYDEMCEENAELNRCCDNIYYGKTHFSPRSQGLDGARRLAGHHGLHLANKDELYFNLDLALAYQRSFNGDKYGKYLSPKCKNYFNIGENGYETTDIYAGNLTDEDPEPKGTIYLCPSVSNFITDINLFIGLNEWIEGLFFEIQAPIVYTKWDPNCCMSQETESEHTVIEAMNGQFNLSGDSIGFQCFGLFCAKSQSKIALADLRMRLGYDFVLNENYHVGIKAILAAPTGNKAKAHFVWEPIAGNGGHVELGGGLTAHAVLWNKDIDKTFSIYSDLELTHMFQTSAQQRSFDLTKNGIFSRYLALKKFTGEAGDSELDGDSRVRGIDILTQDIKVKVNWQIETTTMFRINYDSWIIDFGYNLWARERECGELCCCGITSKTYGVDDFQEGTGTASNSTISKIGDSDSQTTHLKGDCSELDVSSAMHPRAISHSVFAHVAYNWTDLEWDPVIGLGGKAEFSGRGNTALDQWSVWLKGNISF